MRKLLYLAILCLSFAAHAQTCGPPLYASPCSVSDTAIHGYPLPIPSWGPNTACMNAATTMAAIAQCGNLTGAGTTVTTNDDFHAIITKATDSNTHVVPGVANPLTQWQTADEPSVNLWNSDDTAMMLHVVNGNQFVFLWNGTAAQMLYTGPGGDVVGNHNISFPSGTVWSRSANNHIYSLDNSTGPGIYLVDNTVTLTQGAGAVSTSNLFDFAATTGPNANKCLTNAANGTAGTAFPLNKWNGALGSSPDGTVFSVAFSLLGGQGSGYYMASWTVGQPGCRLFNTLTGTVSNNGVLLGTVPNDTWGGAFGGLAPRFKIHDTNQPNSTTTLLSSGANNYVFGTYVDGTFYWDGALGFTQCGITAPDWKAANPYSAGDRILPLPNTPTSTNPGGFIYQIINGVGGNSGPIASEPNPWNQTPGSDTTDAGLTWRNVGIGKSTTPYFTYFCDGHTWKGQLGQAAGKSVTYHSYANPATPFPFSALGPVITPSQVGDTHLGNTNANATDTAWIWITSSDIISYTDLLNGPFPSALYMESFFVAPPFSSPGVPNCVYNAITCPAGTLGQVRRVFHCYGSRWHPAFDVQNCMAVVSQTGKYAMFPSDFMGQSGNTAGGAKCNVGALHWTKNDPSDFKVGSLMMPNPQVGATEGLNAGGYIYKAQSCGGNFTLGAACLTGTVKQTAWIQPGGAFTIASWALASNVVTFTGTYSGPQYVAGNTPTVIGLAHGSYLNGQLTVTSATSTTFKVTFSHTNDSATEAGTAGTAGSAQSALDGNIQWVTAPDVNVPANSAAQNCRADVGIVTLFRGSGPSPATTAPVLTMFTKQWRNDLFKDADDEEQVVRFTPDFGAEQLKGSK